MSGEHCEHSNSDESGPPADVTVPYIVLPKERNAWDLACMEARAVSVLCLLAPLFRLVLASLREWSGTDKQERADFVSMQVKGILSFLPSAVAQDLAPGFIFASAWCVRVGSGCSEMRWSWCHVVRCARDSFSLSSFSVGSCLRSAITLDQLPMCRSEYARLLWDD